MEETSQFTLAELASLTGAKLVGDPSFVVTGFADLESATEHDVSFLSNPRYTKSRYLSAMKQSRAGAIFLAPSIEITEGKNFLIHEDPTRAFQHAIESMRGGVVPISEFHGIHKSATIHETAQVGRNVTIGPNVVIDAYVVIGDNTHINANSYVGPKSRIGADCIIHANVTIREQCFLGNRVFIQPGTVIGTCGFGYSTEKDGKHTHLEHIGTVVIEDDVEIGANSSVDRARFVTTRIARGTKIDNLAAIGHNVQIGEDNLICSQTGIAGSTRTGKHVVIGGQCGIDGHLHLDDGVMVAAKSGVTKSLKRGKYSGYPALPIDEFNRNSVMLRNIKAYINQIQEIKKRLDS